MIERVRTWLNSMQAHMIGFAFGVILVITALSFLIIEIAGPPRRSPMTVYDISRVIRGAPPAQATLLEEFELSFSSQAPDASLQVEHDLAKLLADELRVPPETVRFLVGNKALNYIDFVEKQVDLYRQGSRASPLVHGTVTVALRQPDGRWRVFDRRSRDGFSNVWQLLRASPWVSGLLIIPFSMWFSTRLARPVRAFAAAASRVGDARDEFPVPIGGPTEIRVAAIALNEMQARIRAFLRERTALVGAIAHDLRTPLNNLRFRLANAPDEIRKAAEADIQQLDQLIESTLHYVESDGRSISVEAIDLTALIQSIVDDCEDRARPVSFRGDQVRIEGDIIMLRRMFSNLIDNALKFGSEVNVELSVLLGKAVVEVRDDGPGISPADLPRAFEPFFRGERSRNRGTGGFGLGLSIVRSVADAHSGTVTMQNAPEGGLVVRIVLPLRHQATA